MKPEIAAYLRCPHCEGELSCERTDIVNGRLKSGALECRSGHSFPIADYLPTFSPALGYVGAFEFLWSSPSCDLTVAHGDTFVRELTEREFSQQTQIDPGSLAGKLVLDAGCGGARFAEYLAGFGAEVIGVDMVERALRVDIQRNLGRANLNFFQANLFDLPFREGVFDFIYSLGVLHHTPDCEKAFKGLVRFLKPGGRIAIWVYPISERTPLSDLLRPLTTRLPMPLLYACGAALTAAYAPLLRLPRYRARLNGFLYGLRLPWHDEWRWRKHSFMDWYGAKFQSKHSYEELRAWFENAGLSDVSYGPDPVSAIGRKAV